MTKNLTRSGSHLSDTNVPLTLGYLTLLRRDQASLHQRRHGNVPAGRATVSGVTGAPAAQVVEVTDVNAALLHHRNGVVYGAVSVG